MAFGTGMGAAGVLKRSEQSSIGQRGRRRCKMAPVLFQDGLI
jgi:hypothetical protein